MYKKGIVEGHDIVLETGSSRTRVLQDMVTLKKVIVGKVATMTCAHGHQGASVIWWCSDQ